MSVTAREVVTIREMASKLGIHPDTLRRWERAGIVPPATRRRGYRVYTAEDVERVKAAVFEKPQAGAE